MSSLPVNVVRATVALLMMVCGAASCTSSPTAPSSTPAGADANTASIVPPPVPPRISVVPPTALGATRFVAFGDSLTHGILSSYDGAYLFDVPGYSYVARLQAALNTYHSPQTFSVVGAGVPGEMVTTAHSRFLAMLGSLRPQCVILLEGVNDLNAGVSFSEISQSLASMMDAAALFNATVIVATMPRIYESTDPSGNARPRAPERIVHYNAEIVRIASVRLNVHVVDLYSVFGADRALIGGDGLHPTVAGYEKIATAILDKIEAVFAVHGSFQ